jgi:hypothetical protein
LIPSVSSLIQGFDGAKRSYFPVGPAAGKKQLQLEEEERFLLPRRKEGS